MKNSIEDRFWSKVALKGATECWEWNGWCSNVGYGMFRVGTKHIGAHRFAYELQNGPIPAGMLVLHRCDNKRCVNHAHLFLGTQADNMKDKVAKQRHPTGIDSVNSKLTKQDVIDIRNAYIPRKVSQRSLARRYGVSVTAIWLVLNNKTYFNQ